MLAYTVNPLSIDLVTLGSLKDINQILSNGQVLEESYNKPYISYGLIWSPIWKRLQMYFTVQQMSLSLSPSMHYKMNEVSI